MGNKRRIYTERPERRIFRIDESDTPPPPKADFNNSSPHQSPYGDSFTTGEKAYTIGSNDIERKRDDNNTSEPVPGSAEWIVDNNNKFRKKKLLENGEKLIDEMSDEFPGLSRIFKFLNNEGGENE